MSNVVEFLAKLGTYGEQISEDELLELASSFHLSNEDLRIALGNCQDELAQLVQARTNVFAILVPAEDDDESESEEEPEIKVA